jgi:hypothetical protein
MKVTTKCEVCGAVLQRWRGTKAERYYCQNCNTNFVTCPEWQILDPYRRMEFDVDRSLLRIKICADGEGQKYTEHFSALADRLGVSSATVKKKALLLFPEKKKERVKSLTEEEEKTLYRYIIIHVKRYKKREQNAGD